MKKLLSLLLILHSSFLILHSQEFAWKVDAYGFADNREYRSEVQIPQSMLGIRLTPLVGLKWNEHSIFAGANALKEFGSSKGVDNIIPTVYYDFAGENFDFRFGAFPRAEVLSDFPAAFFQDSLTYYRPNINGLFWQFKKYDNLRIGVFLDWTSRQTDTRREAFIMGGSGRWDYDMFYLKFNYYMYHRAGRAVEDTGDHIHDMGLGYYAVGADLRKIIPLEMDTAYIHAGLLQGQERRRSVSGWFYPRGILVEAGAEYENIGLKNTLYAGEGQQVYYNSYNPERDLYWGDSFYRGKFYNRTDFYYNFINTDRVNCRFDLSLHRSSGEWSWQQQLILQVRLGKN
jgi:hypothetical protein